jgi:DNA-binding GntR family transcriptional regulator
MTQLLTMAIVELMKPLTHRTLSSDVYQQLKELLISGRLMPGENLSLRSVAEALGVSVMPVREAIQRLVAEQALEVGRNRAIRIPIMTESQFREITIIRMHLEGLAVDQAVSLLSKSAIDKLTKISDDFSREISSPQPDGGKVVALNKEFHFAIYEASGMPLLVQLIEALWMRIGPILNFDLRKGTPRGEARPAVDFHAQLVESLRKHDSAKAKLALHRDIETAANFIISAGVLVTPEPRGQGKKSSQSRKKNAHGLSAITMDVT